MVSFTKQSLGTVFREPHLVLDVLDVTRRLIAPAVLLIGTLVRIRT